VATIMCDDADEELSMMEFRCGASNRSVYDRAEYQNCQHTAQKGLKRQGFTLSRYSFVPGLKSAQRLRRLNSQCKKHGKRK